MQTISPSWLMMSRKIEAICAELSNGVPPLVRLPSARLKVTYEMMPNAKLSLKA